MDIKFHVMDFDEHTAVSPEFDTEAEAEAYARGKWGEFWWSNEFPYVVEAVETEG